MTETIAGLERKSSITPQSAANVAGRTAEGILATTIALHAVGIAAEALSLGQVETVFYSVQSILDTLGLSGLAKSFYSLPYQIAVIEPYRHWLNAKYQTYLPPITDLIRFTVREDLGQQWLYNNAKYQGLSEVWANHYWASHWELMPLDLAYTAEARGYITREQLKELVIKHDYRPEDVDALIALSKVNIPRVDLRRGYRYGHIPEDQLKERYMWLRYNERDAEIMAEIAIRQTLDADLERYWKAAERNFKEGFMSVERFRDVLDEVGMPERRKEIILKTAALDYEFDKLNDQIKILESAWSKGTIRTEKELRNDLINLGIVTERTELIVRRNVLKKTYKLD